MRIHSSSLTLLPAGYNRPKIGNQADPRNNAEVDEAKAPFPINNYDDKYQPYTSDSSANELRQAEDTAKLNSDLTNTGNFQFSYGSKVSKALAAYNQDLNKPSFEQTTTLSKKIDVYA